MKLLWNFASAIVFSLLPSEWRRTNRPESTGWFLRAASFSAFLEFGFCFFLVRNFFSFLAYRAAQLNSLSNGALRSSGEGTQLYFQFIISVEYFIHPLSIALLYLTLEGAVRLLSIFIARENLPSLLAVLGLKIAKPLIIRQDNAKSIDDEVCFTPGSPYVLEISSSRPKPEWRNGMTLDYRGELFELAEINEQSSSKRPFKYRFTNKNPGTVIRQFVHFEGN